VQVLGGDEHIVATILIVLAFLLSLAIVLGLFVAAQSMIRKERREGEEGKRGLLDIVRDEEWKPSLALFQFMVWTGLIATLFLFIYLTRIFAGNYNILPSIPTNVLELMGISVAVPIVSQSISVVKSGNRTKQRPKDEDMPPWYSMVMENDKPSLPRMQMFIWTWIAVVIYIGLFLAKLADPSTLQPITNLTLPDIDPTLVLLMGLSQSAYIGGKAVSQEAPVITEISPNEGEVGHPISIGGFRFGDKRSAQDGGEVRFGNNHVPSEKVDRWSKTRIDLKVPQLDSGTYKVLVTAESGPSNEMDFTVGSGGSGAGGTASSDSSESQETREAQGAANE